MKIKIKRIYIDGVPHIEALLPFKLYCETKREIIDIKYHPVVLSCSIPDHSCRNYDIHTRLTTGVEAIVEELFPNLVFKYQEHLRSVAIKRDGSRYFVMCGFKFSIVNSLHYMRRKKLDMLRTIHAEDNE
jgi:hypothetical protein